MEIEIKVHQNNLGKQTFKLNISTFSYYYLNNTGFFHIWLVQRLPTPV